MRDPVFQTNDGPQAHNAGPCHAPGGVAKSKLAVAVLLALTAALALTTAPAFAARGHVFSKEFGSPGSLPGQLKEPSGVAVNESTGNIYVVDKGNNRVERFNSEGVFQSELTGPSATGKGTVTSGSATITEVSTATGAYSPGEEVTAEGLPADTTILTVGEGTLEVSQAATANGTEPAEPLTAHQSFKEPEGIAVDNSCFLHKTPTQETECREADPSAGDV
jgi:DNA-binding beta-propeller fold protein YncE